MTAVMLVLDLIMHMATKTVETDSGQFLPTTAMMADVRGYKDFLMIVFFMMEDPWARLARTMHGKSTM
jgi:hypothetical protein